MAGELLTRERADLLVALPKRIVDPREFEWEGQVLPSDAGKRRYREAVLAPLFIEFRLLSVDTRDRFKVTGYANGNFGYNLIYQTGDPLRRIDTNPVHGYTDPSSGQPIVVVGPHLHAYVEGHDLLIADAVDWYTFDDPEGAFTRFLDLCNVVDRPWAQKAMKLHGS